MNNREWTELLDGIFAAHGKSAPSERVAAKWFEHVYHVPARAALDIARDLERAGRLEQNVGAQFLAGWTGWRAANPDKCASESARPAECGRCEGGNIWWARRDPSGSWGWGCSLCQCASVQGTTSEAIKARGNYPGLFKDVFAWVSDRNREHFGFNERYGQARRFDPVELVRTATGGTGGTGGAACTGGTGGAGGTGGTGGTGGAGGAGGTGGHSSGGGDAPAGDAGEPQRSGQAAPLPEDA